MSGNLAAGNLEGDNLLSPLDGNRDLGTRRALHTADHTVLLEIHASYIGSIHFEQAVARLHAQLLRRPAGDDFNHHGRIVGHIELNADPGEIARKVLFRLLELLGRKIYRMRVKSGQNGLYRSIGDLFAVDRIDIILIDRLKHEVQLAPVVVLNAKAPLVSGDLVHEKRNREPDNNAEE